MKQPLHILKNNIDHNINLQYLDTINKNIKFTLEVKVNNKLNCVYMKILLSKGNFLEKIVHSKKNSSLEIIHMKCTPAHVN